MGAMANPFERKPSSPKETDAEGVKRQKFIEAGGASAAIAGIFGGAGANAAEKSAISPEETEQLSQQARSLAAEEEKLIEGWSSGNNPTVDTAIADRHGRFTDYEAALRAALASGNETQAKRSLLLMELALEDVRKAANSHR